MAAAAAGSVEEEEGHEYAGRSAVHELVWDQYAGRSGVHKLVWDQYAGRSAVHKLVWDQWTEEEQYVYVGLGAPAEVCSRSGISELRV